MENQCRECGKTYQKNPKYSKKQWETSKFCSTLCQQQNWGKSERVSFRKGKKFAEPRKCSVCDIESPRTFMSKLYKILLCDKHFNQLERNGKILWKERTLITPLTRRIRSSKKNVDWRTAIFKRDNFTCTQCEKRGGYLEADHYPVKFSNIFHRNKIISYKQAMECKEFWNTDNGRTLCIKCHRGDSYSVKNKTYAN